MPEPQFWALVDLLGGRVDDEGAGRLTQALRQGGDQMAPAFAERLAETLYELDREELFEQPVRWADDPDGAQLPLSSDTFLYLRCAVVAAGRQAVDAVLADPTALLARSWEDGEALLQVAVEAADAEIDTAVSYETGSNTLHWEPRYERALVAVLPEGWPRWLSTEMALEAEQTVHRIVQDGGGLPASLGAHQVVVAMALGDVWEVAPRVDGVVSDGRRVGQLFRMRTQLSRSVVRSWTADQRRTGLLAVLAGCASVVLPDDHAGRPALERAVADGAELLPPS